MGWPGYGRAKQRKSAPSGGGATVGATRLSAPNRLDDISRPWDDASARLKSFIKE